MYILELYQEDRSIELAAFETLEEGKSFVSKIPTYESEVEDGFTYEYITAKGIPDCSEIEFNGNLIPLSRFMFPEEGRVEIFWKELPNLSLKNQGLVNGVTEIDAYCIENQDVKEYITDREGTYELIKSYLEDKGFEVARDLHGSEDGEAIFYKKVDEDEWHFLTHLDPYLCAQEDVIEYIEEIHDVRE